jgi:hypothetical protein
MVRWMITALNTATAPTADPLAWRPALVAAEREGGGAWRLWLARLLSPGTIDELIDNARAGDRDARRLGAVLGEVIVRLDGFKEPSDVAPNCLLCASPFWRRCYPAIVGVLTGDIAEPHAGIVLGICGPCHGARDSAQALHADVVAALHKCFGLALRPVLLHPAGHA